MPRLRLAFLLFVMLSGLAPAAKAASGPPLSPLCDASAEFISPEGPLPHFSEALRASGTVDILAIGSGTTVGEVNGTPGTSFPYRMIESLRAAWPKATFSLTVRGGRNMTAEDMLPLLRQAVGTGHYALVLWQTGTVEAVRGLRPDSLRGALRSGIDAAQAAGGDVVLIDSQFSRFLRANADLDPYEQVLRDSAMLPDVALFRRFDLMRYWANEGRIDLERARKQDREVAVTSLNVCLGQMLARFVTHGMVPPVN
jgi:hypothetical protein